MKPLIADTARKTELAMIHVAKKQLALADDEYRSIMAGVTGKHSAADLDAPGRRKLLDYFKKIGFKARSKAGGRARPRVGAERAPLMRKIEAQLAEAGRPWAYADGVVKRLFATTTRVERIEFCDAAHLAKVVAALAFDAKRRAKKSANTTCGRKDESDAR